jgi:Tfp pilus assembly major pilin PilA
MTSIELMIIIVICSILITILIGAFKQADAKEAQINHQKEVAQAGLAAKVESLENADLYKILDIVKPEAVNELEKDHMLVVMEDTAGKIRLYDLHKLMFVGSDKQPIVGKLYTCVVGKSSNSARLLLYNYGPDLQLSN